MISFDYANVTTDYFRHGCGDGEGVRGDFSLWSEGEAGMAVRYGMWQEWERKGLCGENVKGKMVGGGGVCGGVSL